MHELEDDLGLFAGRTNDGVRMLEFGDQPVEPGFVAGKDLLIVHATGYQGGTQQRELVQPPVGRIVKKAFFQLAEFKSGGGCFPDLRGSRVPFFRCS